MPWWTCFNCANIKATHNDSDDVYILDFTHHSLHDVPPSVFIHERSLEELYLSSNRITELPRQLFYCHELKVLHLNDNDLSQVPAAISSLANLRKINLSRNSLTRLTDSIVACKSINYLDLSVNNLEKLPNAITGLLQLEELYLNDTFLELLPSDLGQLANLRILELRDNNLITLPKTMARLTKLRRLDIGNNEFTELPEIVGTLTALTELWCDGNRIRRIGSGLGELRELIHFDCSNNLVQFLPDEIGNWQRCQEICLSANELEELPYSIGMMRSLVSLKIDENQLEELPDSICELENLEELMLSHNDLFKLPPTIGLLRRLRFLTADENLLRVLPNELCSCSSLTILSVRGNKLSKIPVDIGRLTKLRVLNLVNNFLNTLPVTILNLSNLSALWMSDNQSQPLMPLQKEFHKESQSFYLTCFLLPQMNTANSTPTNAASTPTAQDSVYDYFSASNRSDMTSKQTEMSLDRYGNAMMTKVAGNGFAPDAQYASSKRKICFATDPPEEITLIGQTGRLMRSPTPYPKELRMMAKFANKNHINQSQKYIHPKNLTNNLDKHHENDVDDPNVKLLNVHAKIAEYKQSNRENVDTYVPRPPNHQLQQHQQVSLPANAGYMHQPTMHTSTPPNHFPENRRFNRMEAMNEMAGKQSYGTTYNNETPNGSIDKVDGSNTFYNGRDGFSSMHLLGSKSVPADAIGGGHKATRFNSSMPSPTTHDAIASHAHYQPMTNFDAQNHNIDSLDMTNCNDVTATSSYNNTSYAQSTQQPQQPPPYHIAKAFTKKSRQDLLIYDIYRSNYQHSHDEPHSPQINSIDNKESIDADPTIESNALCDKINANVNGNDSNGDSISPFNPALRDPSTGTTAQPKRTSNNANPTTSSISSTSSTTNNTTATATGTMPWLFGKHEISTVIQLNIPKVSSDIGIQIISHNNQGIFVSDVENGSAAYGIVHVMDKILDVNDMDFTKISLADARAILRSDTPILNIMVSRKK